MTHSIVQTVDCRLETKRFVYKLRDTTNVYTLWALEFH